MRRGTRLAVALTAAGGFLLSSGLVLITETGAQAVSHSNNPPGKGGDKGDKGKGNGDTGNGKGSDNGTGQGNSGTGNGTGNGSGAGNGAGNGNGNGSGAGNGNGSGAGNGNGGNPAPHKSYVCKYVGNPERLQTGNNPVWVANQALLGYDGTVSVGQSFSDGQVQSVVIVANTGKLSPEPDASQCPLPNSPQLPTTDGSVNVTVASPRCPTGSVTYSFGGDHVTYSGGPTSGTVLPGQADTTITRTGTTDSGYTFPGGATTKLFTATIPGFDPASCATGKPVVAPEVTFTNPTTCSGTGSWSSTALDHVAYSPSSTGRAAAGTSVTVVASSDGSVAFNSAGDTTQRFSHLFTAPTGCSGGETSPPQVVGTTAPTFTDATCDAPTTTALKLPGVAGTATGGALATSVDSAGVTYTATGSTAVGHTVVVKATAGSDQVFGSGTTTTWTHHFAAPTDCSSTLPPTHQGHHGQHGQHGQHGHHSGGGTSAEHTVTEAPQASHTPAGTVVPTMVDAGQVGVMAAASPTSVLASLREYAVLLVIAGGLLLLGGGSWLGTGSWLGRSRRGRGALG